MSAYRRIGVSAYRRIGVSAYRRVGVVGDREDEAMGPEGSWELSPGFSLGELALLYTAL